MEFVIKAWRENKVKGPDVEEIMFVPLLVAIEDKKNVKRALEDIAQIIGFADSGKYDAVILRIENEPGSDQELELKRLVNIVNPYGIGIVVGGKPYTPLDGTEMVLLKAGVNLREKNITGIAGLRLITVKVQDLGEFTKYLHVYRKFFDTGWTA